MAETIKGINVVIGAETTGLQKSISDVNKKSKDLQSELKQVEKLLKLDPTNTELVAQKQKLLSDAVANTQEKLERLKAAQEQVNQQFNTGQISEGKYRAFQREIAATEQELKRLTGQLEATGDKADSLGDRLSTAGDKMKGVGEKMTVGVTAPTVAAGGLMLKGAIDASAAQGLLQASLGLTAEQAKRLEAIALDVWKNGFGESIAEVNQAVTSVRQNIGFMADEELQAVTEGAMTIAQVFSQDVNEVTRAAGVMVKNYGISGKEALDILTVGFQKGGDYSGELLDTMREYAPQFKSIGLTADQSMAMLINGAQAGAFNLDKVGDAMKEFNLRAQDGSKTTADGFAAIGLNAKEMGAAIATGGEEGTKAYMATIAALAGMKNPMAQNQAGVALFGTQWEDVRSQVIMAMSEGVKGLDDYKGATDSATKAVQENNPGIALKKALREVQVAVGPALQPIADIIKTTIAPALKSMAESFADLSPGAKKAVLAFLAIAAAIGPLMVVFGPIVSVITGVAGAIGAMGAAAAAGATGFGILTTAFPALGAVIAALTGPIGIVILAITGIAAAAVLIYKNWDSITEFFSNLWDGIKETITNAAKSIWAFLKEWGPLILAVITGPLGLIIYAIAKNWDKIKEFFSNAASQAIKMGQNIVQGLIDGITGFIGRVVEAATNLAGKISSTVKRILGIESPSKVMTEFGRYVAEGLAVGMKDGESEVEKSAQKLASAISDTVRVMTGDLSNAIALTDAQFELEKQALSSTASEVEKLTIDLKKLVAEKDNQLKKIEIITAAYETAREKLGENSETTKQYAQELKMAQIEVDKMGISIRKTEAAIDSEKNKAKEAAKVQAQGLRDLAQEVTIVEQKYRQDLAAALDDYEAKVKAVNENLSKQEADLTKQYEDQLAARADALSNFTGLFDAVTTKEVSGDQLLSNLEGQVKAFEDWQANITELGSKGIDEGLLEQLRQMGPQAGSEIAALNTMTAGQLTEYVALWKEKQALARTEATTELQAQRDQMQTKLQEIRQAASEQLEAYRAEWEKKNADIRKNAETELNKISDKFKGIAEAGTKYGISLMGNFNAGMTSQFDALKDTLEAAASIVDSYMPHSPAKVGPLKRLGEWGPSLVKTFSDGIRDSLPDIDAAMGGLAARVAISTEGLGDQSTGNTYHYGGASTVYITVQDGEDLVRTLHRLGYDI